MALLRELYAGAKLIGFGKRHFVLGPLPQEAAREFLAEGQLNFNYCQGRPI